MVNLTGILVYNDNISKLSIIFSASRLNVTTDSLPNMLRVWFGLIWFFSLQHTYFHIWLLPALPCPVIFS